MLAASGLDSEEAQVLVFLLILACLGGAAYLAYLRNVVGAILMLVVAVVAAFLLT
jgi:hypothetical protein